MTCWRGMSRGWREQETSPSQIGFFSSQTKRVFPLTLLWAQCRLKNVRSPARQNGILKLDVGVLTCSAEDLLVHKAFAARDRDWLDIDGIVRRQAELDWALVFRELEPLAKLKDAPEIVPRLRKISKS